MALTQNEILIMAALGPNECYGSEIADEVARLTRERVKLSLGGLYTTLNRMENKKLISARWGERRAEEPSAQRRYYRITALGAKLLRESEATLAAALAAIRAFGTRSP